MKNTYVLPPNAMAHLEPRILIMGGAKKLDIVKKK